MEEEQKILVSKPRSIWDVTGKKSLDSKLRAMLLKVKRRAYGKMYSVLYDFYPSDNIPTLAIECRIGTDEMKYFNEDAKTIVSLSGLEDMAKPYIRARPNRKAPSVITKNLLNRKAGHEYLLDVLVAIDNNPKYEIEQVQIFYFPR